jgi:hypothetical protein
MGFGGGEKTWATARQDGARPPFPSELDFVSEHSCDRACCAQPRATRRSILLTSEVFSAKIPGTSPNLTLVYATIGVS